MPKVRFPGKASDFLKIGVAAAARGDVEAVRAILRERPEWLMRIGSHGRTILWEASHRGKFEMVRYIVRRGADIDACGTHYTLYFVEISCYCIARHKKHDDVADLLLEKGAKIDLHTVAFLGDCEGVKRILKQDPKLLHEGHPQSAPAPWATPLCYALRGGDVETVKVLIERGAKIKGNENPFFIAANNNVDKVRLLLEHGADPQELPSIYKDEGELFELVSSYGAKPRDAANCSGDLVYLCRGDRGGNPGEVKRLLSVGADVGFQDRKGKTALHRAARAGFVETMAVLLDHGASVETEDPSGETPLFDVIRSTIKSTENKNAAVRLLLKAGADPHHANPRGETPLSIAESARHPAAKDLAKMLRRHST